MQINFKEYFYYDENTPTGLRWKKNLYSVKGLINRKAREGRPAGGVNDLGYYCVGLLRKRYSCHRIIWEILKDDPLVGMCIDHIDGDRSNNRIENLRNVTKAENSRNKSKRLKSNGLPMGVSKFKRRNKGGVVVVWTAFWNDANGKAHVKSFSESIYGESAYKFALEYRIKSIEQLNKQGLGYHENHGRDNKGE